MNQSDSQAERESSSSPTSKPKLAIKSTGEMLALYVCFLPTTLVQVGKLANPTKQQRALGGLAFLALEELVPTKDMFKTMQELRAFVAEMGQVFESQLECIRNGQEPTDPDIMLKLFHALDLSTQALHSLLLNNPDAIFSLEKNFLIVATELIAISQFKGVDLLTTPYPELRFIIEAHIKGEAGAAIATLEANEEHPQ